MPVINTGYFNKLNITETLEIYIYIYIYNRISGAIRIFLKISYEEKRSKLTTLNNTEGKLMI
jgi:hypothetical protein